MKLFRCCWNCCGESTRLPATNHHLEKQLSKSSSTPTIQTPSGTLTTLSLTSPLFDTIVTTTLIGVTTASVTASTSSPILSPTSATPLLAENLAAYDFLTSSGSQTGSAYSVSSSTQPQLTDKRVCQNHFQTDLPHIDEGDEDVEPISVRQVLLIGKRQTSDNPTNASSLKSNKSNDSSTFTPSPKIKVNRIKFNTPNQQQQQQLLILQQNLSSSVSSTSRKVFGNNL